MHESSIIDRRIAAILTGSGLPLERRAEVADELRSHLEQLISAKHRAGMTGEHAVDAVLTDFGSPNVIRNQLKKQQRRLDRRLALLEVRGCIWWLVSWSGLFGIVCAITAPGSVAAGPRCLIGACLFASMLLIVSVPMYLAELLSLPVQRRRPNAEYSFPRSIFRHAVVVFLFLACTLATGPLVIGFGGYIGQNSLFHSILPLAPEVVEGAPWLFWRNLGIVAWESPIRCFLTPVLLVIVSALVIALYERSRCVDVATFPAPGR